MARTKPPITKTKFTSDEPLKRTRTKPSIVKRVRTRMNTIPTGPPSGPHGGWMKNPPDHCKYKKRDIEGWWVETPFCGHICKDLSCPVHRILMKGRRQRIQALSFKSVPKKCPHCSAQQLPLENDYQEIVTYSCKTTASKKTGLIEKHCGKRRRTK